MPDDNNSEQTDKSQLKLLIQSDEDKILHKLLLEYIKINNIQGEFIVAFILSDNSIKFSSSKMLDVLGKISEEAIFSDRLWVIVSIAYLEDQLRTLLAKFFTDEEVTQDLLDPNQSLVASLIPMSNLAFSLGLIAKNWHNALKKMAQLRNKFAHIPSANSFDELAKIDPKSAGLMQSIQERYAQLTGQEVNSKETFKEMYKDLFGTMFHLMQFSIEHLATVQQRQRLSNDTIKGLRIFAGFDEEILQKLLNEAK